MKIPISEIQIVAIMTKPVTFRASYKDHSSEGPSAEVAMERLIRKLDE